MRQERAARGLPVDAQSLRAALVGEALDLGSPGPDGSFGAGMARLDTSPPRVRIRVGAGRRPLVRVSASDEGTLRRVSATLDGRPLRAGPGPRLAFRLPALSAGRHVLAVTASDMAENVAFVRMRVGARR
jgi:hypothetical protein